MEFAFLNISQISEEELQNELKLMLPRRRERILRYKKKGDRVRSIAGEILAKRMLKSLYDVDNPEIYHDEKGKPFTDIEGVNLSISHSENMVVCVISENPVGIDVEKIKPFNYKLINKVCTDRESEYVLSDKDEKDILLRFYEVWTAKEGYFKREGTGITKFKSVDIFDLERKHFIVDDYFIQIVS